MRSKKLAQLFLAVAITGVATIVAAPPAQALPAPAPLECPNNICVSTPICWPQEGCHCDLAPGPKCVGDGECDPE